MKISRVRIFEKHLPLRKPYPLSFTTVESFRSCLISVETDTHGRGAGEATALPGYSAETHEDIFLALKRAAAVLPSLGSDQAECVVNKMFDELPFAASALGTALDFAFGRVSVPEKFSIPLLTPLSPYVAPAELEKQLETAFSGGYKTIKVKVGRHIGQDISSLAILSGAPPEIIYRFDANQGYSFKNAALFIEKLAEIKGPRVEFLEQPFAPDNWGQMEELCRMSPIPLMLDESIFNEADIRRAASIGTEFVKLKLCKTRGVKDLLAKAELAHCLGLKVVLGNGVATDITNLIEAVAMAGYPDFFYGAFEGNGFAKTEEALLGHPLQIKSGRVIWWKKEPLFPDTFFR